MTPALASPSVAGEVQEGCGGIRFALHNEQTKGLRVELHQRLTRELHQKLTHRNWHIYLTNAQFWFRRWVNLKWKRSGKLAQYSMQFNSPYS